MVYMLFEEIIQNGENRNKSLVCRISRITSLKDRNNSGKFQSTGNFPLFKDELKSFVTLGVIAKAVASSTPTDIPSDIPSAPVSLFLVGLHDKLFFLVQVVHALWKGMLKTLLTRLIIILPVILSH